MRCSVVFGLTLRFLVINISSSSPTVNTAAYYQRCVITCDTLWHHWRPRWQHLPVAALTQAVKPDIGSESRFLPTLPAFDAPVRGEVPVGNRHPVWCAKTRMVWLHNGKKNFDDMFIRFDMIDKHDRHTETDRYTDTTWRHRPRLCIASRGKKR